MSQPQVTIDELDGQLGVLPPSAGRLLAMVGAAVSGPFDTPATFARVQDIRAVFTGGLLVEAAAYYIQRFGRPVVLVRTHQSVPSTLSAVFPVGASPTGVDGPSLHAAPAVNDEQELYIRILTGGETGTAGITYLISYDGGRTVSPVRALGTSLQIAFDEGATIIEYPDETEVTAGDAYRLVGAPATWNATDLGTALDALGATAALWELVHIVGAIDANAFDLIELKLAAMNTRGNRHAWIGNTRMPTQFTTGDSGAYVAETEAAYLTAMTAALGSKSTKCGTLCAGAAKITSAISGRKYRRPASLAIAALQASVSEEINIADVNLGALVGVSIRDANGNPDEHDESINPGLDDARFCTLRTWDGDDFSGVYVNRPRLFSPNGSDFQLMPHRRVINLGHAALYAYFVRRLNKPILIDRNTGFILESERLEIQSGAIAAMRSVLLAKPKASDVTFALSKTDNLLSTKTLTGDGRILPLAYPEYIGLSVGFVNPALQLQAV